MTDAESKLREVPKGAKPVFEPKTQKKKFALHVQLIEFQDDLTKADAQAKAYWEGLSGLPRRAGKTA